MKSLRNIDLNLLVVFEAIYTRGNISQAAEQLGVSQPTISNSLTRLRESLGDKLFERSKKGVSPTTMAEQLIKPVREALQMIQIGINEAEEFDHAFTERKFKLMVAEPLEPYILPNLINDLPESSRMTFDHIHPLAQDVETSLISGSTDLAVFLLPPKTADLQMEVLCEVDLVTIARKDHPRLSKLKEVTTVDLLAEGHVTLNLESNTIRNIGKVQLLQTPIRRVVCRVSNVGALARLVGETDLLGMVPRKYAQYAAKYYDLDIFDLPLKMNEQNFFMIWHKKNNEDNGHKWLRNRVSTIFKES